MSNATLHHRDPAGATAADADVVPPIGEPMSGVEIEDIDEVEVIADHGAQRQRGSGAFFAFLAVWIVAGVLLGVLIDQLTNPPPERPVVDASKIKGSSFDAPAGTAQIEGLPDDSTRDRESGPNASGNSTGTGNTAADGDTARRPDGDGDDLNAGNDDWLVGPDIPPPSVGRALEAALGALEPKPREGFTATTFDYLASFDYGDDDMEALLSGEKPKIEIPEEFLALDGTRVALNGFFTPLQTPPTQTFVLMRFLMACCFGRFPRMNEWVQVEMAGGKQVDLPGDSMITVYGTLEVEAVYDEAGWCERVFRIIADDVIKISIGGR